MTGGGSSGGHGRSSGWWGEVEWWAGTVKWRASGRVTGRGIEWLTGGGPVTDEGVEWRVGASSGGWGVGGEWLVEAGDPPARLLDAVDDDRGRGPRPLRQVHVPLELPLVSQQDVDVSRPAPVTGGRGRTDGGRTAATGPEPTTILRCGFTPGPTGLLRSCAPPNNSTHGCREEGRRVVGNDPAPSRRDGSHAPVETPQWTGGPADSERVRVESTWVQGWTQEGREWGRGISWERGTLRAEPETEVLGGTRSASSSTGRAWV